MLVSVPKVLRGKLSDEGAEALVKIIDKVEDRTQKVVLEMAEEKFEKRVAQVETKIAQAEARLETKIAETKADLESRFSRLEVNIAQSRAEIIRWSFVFAMGQFWSLVGAMFVFFHK